MTPFSKTFNEQARGILTSYAMWVSNPSSSKHLVGTLNTVEALSALEEVHQVETIALAGSMVRLVAPRHGEEEFNSGWNNALWALIDELKGGSYEK